MLAESACDGCKLVAVVRALLRGILDEFRLGETTKEGEERDIKGRIANAQGHRAPPSKYGPCGTPSQRFERNDLLRQRRRPRHVAPSSPGRPSPAVRNRTSRPSPTRPPGS